MRRIVVRDPLALLAIQSGKVGTPIREEGASASGRLCVSQRAVVIGEPVPIVFGRRREGYGGVFISPGATEARFENNTDNEVKAYYHLVLSEGQIDSIQVRDVFQCACRVGSFTQTYNRRAGDWLPGNFIVDRPGKERPEAPYFCGSVGTYPDISTLSFENTSREDSTDWSQQVHAFIRGGFRLTRLLDNVIGPSDNFCDLVRLAWRRSRRVPESLIDTAALQNAARFLEVNQFTCNAWIQDSRNISDFVSRWAPWFLLGRSKRDGKNGLRPLLPTNSNGTIDTSPVTWEYIFTEDLIVPGSFELDYTTYADRQPFVAQIVWRQELDDDLAIIRTSEVRFATTAEDGPYESFDLSEFCTREIHAVKVGAYILSKRLRSTHTIRFAAMPEAHSSRITEGSIIRVKLPRTSRGAANSFHDYLYQVERIRKTLAGDVTYECSHYPIDSDGRSLIALDVVNTQPTGVLLTSNKTGLSCDINDEDDTTVPPEVFIPPDPEDPPIDVPVDPEDPGVVDPGIGGGGGGSGPENPGENPTDQEDGGSSSGPPGSQDPDPTPGGGPVPGSALFPSQCADGLPEQIIVRRNGEEIARYSNGGGNQTITNPGGATLLIDNGRLSGVIIPPGASGDTYQIEVECPDGSRNVQEVPIGPDPFPDAYFVYRFSYMFNDYAGPRKVVSPYGSVNAPPTIVFTEAETIVYATNVDGTIFQAASGPTGLIEDLQITRVIRATDVSGLGIHANGVVSENIIN